MTPVYVPSRQRCGASATLRLLSEEGHPDVSIVTPPGETQKYAAEYDLPGWRVIPQQGTGIGLARQSCLEDARERRKPRFWMLDDDTTGAFERNAARRYERRTLSEIMSAMVSLVNLTGVSHAFALFGPNFRHRAWSGPDAEPDTNLRNFVCVNTNAPIAYQDMLKEDLDAVLQAITRGWHTYRFNSYAFDSPRMGSMQGGCRDDYEAGKLDDATEKLKERWPDYVTIRFNEKEGYAENRVDWKAVRLAGLRIRQDALGLYKSPDQV